MYSQINFYFGISFSNLASDAVLSATTTVDAVVTESPLQTDFNRPQPNAMAAQYNPSSAEGLEHDQDDEGDTSDTNSDSDSDYVSFDSDHEDTYPQTKEEREAREHERQLVLEAAGLIFKQDVKPPPRLARSKSKSGGKRRPPPAAPNRLSVASSISLKDLPPLPEPEPLDQATHLNDAFNRYESFRQHQANRLSVASVASTETTPISPTASIISPSISKEGESRTYSLLHFLGRKTPEAEKRIMPVISGPILHVSTEDASRASSPAFGSVRDTLFSQRLSDFLLLP